MTTLERQAIIHAGPWILYDGTCGFCARARVYLSPIVTRRGFRLIPLQSPTGSAFDSGRDEMQVITRHGKVIGGMEAFAYVCARIWWAFPFTLLWHLHFCRPPLNWIYRRIAANRYRLAGKCEFRSNEEENPYATEL